MSLPKARRIAKYTAALLALAALGTASPARGARRIGQAEGRNARIEVPAAPAMRTVTDAMGRRIEIPVRVRRVLSLAPNITDILYALGANTKIAGITNFTVIPPGAPAKPNVGEPLEPSLERIVALKPDLVFTSRTINRRETVESLDRLGIAVYVNDAESVEGMLASVRRIADLIGMGPAGVELSSRLQKRLDVLQAHLADRPPKRVLYVVWENPLITTGENTFIADSLRRAGARSALRLSQAWPHISLEEVVHVQPDDVIFSATSSGVAGNIARLLRNRAGWRDLKAVREGHVLVVSNAISRPSPGLVDAIEQLAHELHPEAFSAGEPSAAAAAGRGGR